MPICGSLIWSCSQLNSLHTYTELSVVLFSIYHKGDNSWSFWQCSAHSLTLTLTLESFTCSGDHSWHTCTHRPIVFGTVPDTHAPIIPASVSTAMSVLVNICQHNLLCCECGAVGKAAGWKHCQSSGILRCASSTPSLTGRGSLCCPVRLHSSW